MASVARNASAADRITELKIWFIKKSSEGKWVKKRSRTNSTAVDGSPPKLKSPRTLHAGCSATAIKPEAAGRYSRARSTPDLKKPSAR